MKKLLSIQPNTPCTIAAIDDSAVKDRLYEMGLYPEQPIQIVRKAPFGDPIVVRVAGEEIMIRLDEAALISIKDN